MVPDSDYRIKLPVFEGPLDLLLFLIRKNELEIYDKLYGLIRSTDFTDARSKKKYLAFLMSHPEIEANNSFDDNLEILKEKFALDSLEEARNYFENELGLNLNTLFFYFACCRWLLYFPKKRTKRKKVIQQKNR